MQLQAIYGYLFRLAEKLNLCLDSGTERSLTAAQLQSPRSLFNSMKRLMAHSAELIDSYYAEIHRRLQSIFLSISDFRQFSTNTDEKFSETEKKILDKETELSAKIDSLRAQIPQIPQPSRENGWYILRHGHYAELWGEAQVGENSLPVAFESAVVVPVGQVEGAILSISTEFDNLSVHIIGKEMQS